MVRRDFITPPDLPNERIQRCLRIPASQEWLGVFNAALLFATEAWRYEQLYETSLTPEEAAAVAYDVFVEYLEGACGIMDVRQNPFDPCTLEKTFDGETWEPFALLLLCAGELPAVVATIPPATGELQVTDGVVEWSADGTTWTDMPTPGPLPPTAPVSAQPGDTTAKRCLAAANATNVLSQFYQQTVGAVAAGAANTLGTMNAFLQSVNHVLINLVFPYWQDSVLGAWLFEQQDFETNWAAPALTTGQQDDLRCLLFCYSSVDAEGVTRFDFQAIIDNAITDLGVNPGTAITGMLAYIQAPGLDAAGSTKAITSADCGDCGCIVCEDYVDDMDAAQGSLTNAFPYQSITGAWDTTGNEGAWQSSGGRTGGGCWNSAIVGTFSGAARRASGFVIDLQTECDIESVSFWQRENTTGRAAGRSIKYLDGDKVHLRTATFNTTNTTTAYKQFTDSTPTAGVRYIVIWGEVNATLTSAIFTDDVSVQVTEAP